MKISTLLSAVLLIGTAMIINSTAYAGERTTGRGTGPIVYVTSQGLYFDSIVVADLPMHGNFQQLTPTMNGLTTEYGPGQPGHLGGRWWLDLTNDGVMNEGDKFFLCPLLGPGRDTP
jgi:hypothetical protein